jgi:dTDP-glucose 4,6-dehydratase
MKILVTGGCGFIGSHFIEHVLARNPDDSVVNLDLLTYAAHPDTVEYLASLAPSRYRFVHADINSTEISPLLRTEKIDAIVNFAAESHVDRSIIDPNAFVRANVLGVQNLLHQARQVGNIRFVQVSTDEVYGSLEPGEATCVEDTHLHPNSPYAASKASADLMAMASFRTFKQPILITRCTNNFGPFQFPEKLLPLVIANALEDKDIPVYGDGRQVRDWIYVKDHCSGVDAVLRRGKPGETYNISASQEMFNVDVIGRILKLVGKPVSLLKHVGDRPAHDRRYGLNADKIRRELGWKPAYTFDDALAETVTWYRDNDSWWKKVRGADYYKYYQKNYDEKFKQQKGERSL